MSEHNNSQFAVGKKWFTIGLVITIISPLAGFVYGIALSLEPGRGKEGRIIMIASAAMTAITLVTLSTLR